MKAQNFEHITLQFFKKRKIKVGIFRSSSIINLILFKVEHTKENSFTKRVRGVRAENAYGTLNAH